MQTLRERKSVQLKKNNSYYHMREKHENNDHKNNENGIEQINNDFIYFEDALFFGCASHLHCHTSKKSYVAS